MKDGWKSLTDSLSKFSADFMKEKIQPELDQMEVLFK